MQYINKYYLYGLSAAVVVLGILLDMDLPVDSWFPVSFFSIPIGLVLALLGGFYSILFDPDTNNGYYKVAVFICWLIPALYGTDFVLSMGAEVMGLSGDWSEHLLPNWFLRWSLVTQLLIILLLLWKVVVISGQGGAEE